MTPAEMVSGLVEALQQQGGLVFEFTLADARHWFSPCPRNVEWHREPKPSEFGVWCRCCGTAYVPVAMYERATKEVLAAAAKVMIG